MSRPPVAVLGTGSIGMRHLRALRALGARTFAVPVRSARLGELREQGYETAASLGEAAALGARACIVATDTGRHVEDGLEALSLRMDVLMEKPAAPTAAGARRLAAAAGRLRRRLFVGCVLRFSPSLNRFRALLPRLGRVHSVCVECRSFLPDWRPGRPYRLAYSARREDGGVLRDLIHEIDYAGWLFGWPRRAAGRTLNTGRLGIRSEELADVWWELERGPAVSIGLDYLTRPGRRRMIASGERGTLEWDAFAGRVALLRPGRAPVVHEAAEDRDGWYHAQVKAFLSAAAGGPAGALASAQDAVKALEICDRARRG